MSEIVRELGKVDEIVMVTPHKATYEHLPNTQVVFLPNLSRVANNNLSYLFARESVHRIVKEHRPEVVLAQHTPHHWAALEALSVGRLYGIPVVVRAEDFVLDMPEPLNLGVYLYSLFNNNLLLSLGQSARKLLVVSSELARVVGAGRLEPTRIRVSPNGADRSFFEAVPSSELQRLKVSLGIEHLILYVGSLHGRDDRLDLLVRAIPYVERENPHTQFLVVGDARSDVARLSAQLAEKLGIRSLRFLGTVPHRLMPGIIACSNICIGLLWPNVISSYSCPLKVVEYMACSKPIVSFPTSSDVLEDKVNAVLLTQRSPRELASKLNLLLSDTRYAASLAEAARTKAVRQFEWSEIVRRIRMEMLSN